MSFDFFFLVQAFIIINPCGGCLEHITYYLIFIGIDLLIKLVTKLFVFNFQTL